MLQGISGKETLLMQKPTVTVTNCHHCGRSGGTPRRQNPDIKKDFIFILPDFQYFLLPLRFVGGICPRHASHRVT